MNRTKHHRCLIPSIVVALLSIVYAGLCAERPNVLFIAVDDLRPELGCYGHKHIKTPNIDSLAKTARIFTRHYVQVPTCGASRYALLSGRRPRERWQTDNGACVKGMADREKSDSPESVVHHFRKNGYRTVGIGKISHYPDGQVYKYTAEPSGKWELPQSWDEMLFDSGKWKTGHNAFFGYADGSNRQSRKRQVKPYEMGDVDDDGYPDGLTTKLATRKLDELAKQKKPFFLAVGFFKPHLPFTAPKRYWDMYDRAKIPLSPNRELPKDSKGLHGSGEFNGYRLGDEKANLEKPVSEDYERKLRHAYFACVSYVDAQIGIVLDQLEKLKLADNTVVVLWGDHGWHLGDHLVWGKHTVFERALHSPLIIRAPKLAEPGKSSKALAETLDIYPTLTALCGLSTPDGLDGKSLVPVLKNPSASVTNAAYGYFRGGVSMRTDRYRMTRYAGKTGTRIELYDHSNDPNETVNIAEKQPDIVKSLLPLLERGDTGVFTEKAKK